MTFRIGTGDFFRSGARALVSPVNTLGAHGAGLAKEIAKRHPDAAKTHTHQARAGGAPIGCVWAIWSPGGEKLTDEEMVSNYGPKFTPGSGTAKLIYFLPTKEHWRDASRLDWVEQGIVTLAKQTEGAATCCRSIAIPALGCGLGGLDAKDVEPLVEEAFRTTSIEAIFFRPEARKSPGRRGL